MSVILVDILCAILVIVGITLALKGSRVSPGLNRFDPGAGQASPATYALRIAGVMVAAFGIALGAMVTAFALASG